MIRNGLAIIISAITNGAFTLLSPIYKDNRDLLLAICKTTGNVADKVIRVITSLSGWLSSSVVFILTWVAGFIGDTREMCVYFVMVAVLLDFFWGMASSIKRGTFALSIGITKTAVKLAMYISIMAIVVLSEKAIADEWNLIFRLVSSVLIVAEAISVAGHMLIIKPDMPVIRLLWKVLKSEVAKKLGIEVSDIESFIDEQIKLNNKSPRG